MEVTSTTPLDALLWSLAAAGHTALWLAFCNHAHATAMPWFMVQTIGKFGHAMLLAGWLAAAWWLQRHGSPWQSWSAWRTLPPGAQFYLAFSLLLGAGPVPWWFYRRLTRRHPAALLRQAGTSLDLSRVAGRSAVGHGWRSWYLHIPGNESLRLECNEKQLLLPRLPLALDGLSIAHFSDLHFHGAISQPYFEAVIDEVNRLRGDIVVLAGDIIDHRRCLEWIVPLLGRLTAPYGVYFVLGNHDLRVKPVARLRQLLAEAGLVDLGGRWLPLEISGQRLILAGNELPYLAPAADMATVPPRQTDGTPLRVLLAHTPDQFVWAQHWDFDLVLAGHMHGGQIGVPGLGAIVGPSRRGVEYAEGVFHERDTVMHVSRGVSGLLPLRWGCSPEITRIVLRSTSILRDGQSPAETSVDESACHPAMPTGPES